MLRLQIDDTAIMTGSRNVRPRIIDDGRKVV